MTAALAMTYAVHWPELGILKVGRTRTMRRIRSFIRTGARVRMLIRDTPATWERGALEAMRERFDARFTSEAEALPELPHGRGWTECFWVMDEQEVRTAITTILQGTTRYDDDEAPADDAGRLARRGPAAAEHARAADVVRAPDVRRRRGPRVGERGEDRGCTVPPRPIGDRGHDRHDAAPLRGARPAGDVRRRPAHVLRAAPVAACGPAAGVAHPAAAGRDRIAIASGIDRGRGREVGERGERGERGARGGRGPLATQSGSGAVALLLEAPGRDRTALRRMRHGEEASRDVPPREALDDAHAPVRGRRGRSMTERFICPTDHKHGETQTCYTNHGCRCDDCRALNRDYMFWRAAMIRAGRAPVKSVDAIGTRRRIEALMALGWGAGELARRLGTTVQAVNVYRTEERVVPATAQRVADLYEQLWDQRPEATTMPERVSLTRTLKFARARGFHPPLAWDDIDLDEGPQTGIEVDFDHARVALAVDGVRVDLSTREREEVVRVMNGQGRLDGEIAKQIGVATNTVLRIRQRLGLPERFNQINGLPGYRGEDAA